MLFAIGLDAEIVGVTNFCDYPKAAKAKDKIGGYFTPNIEAILSLKPDLIIATPDGYSKERVEKLDAAGMSAFVVNPRNIDGVLETMLMLGKVTGKEDNAKRVVKELAIRVRAVKEKAAAIPMEIRPKVFYEVGHDPIITAGPETFVDNIITEAGGINIAADANTDWPRYSVEAIITKEPDIIITAPHTSSDGDDNKETRLNVWRRFRTIPAVQNNRIYPMDSNILLRPGPRVIDGLEAMNAIFEEFWKNRKNAKTE
jgi:iron complex transport system substrate-binding protein